jgi:tryptophanyl-tRNA synthetase
MESVAVVPGLDGKKMSKSAGNTIEIFEPENNIKKKVMRIKTDSTPLEDPKDPGKCHVMALLRLVAAPEETAQWEEKYRSGGVGYGTVKKRLSQLLLEYFGPYRQKRADLANNLDFVEKVLSEGAKKARHVARHTMNRVRKAIGMRG